MMYYLYIIKSAIKSRHYIGITNDVEKRLRQHNSGKVRSASLHPARRLALEEKFENKREARRRELFLKRNYKARKEVFDKIDNAAIV